ncbi:MAG TPA: antitoxin VapB family protein [Candidatus Acidoferrales bacterium]|nr:antitoxin VapB family protein [Candidatus Acidoferrales bacterium]
MKTIMVSDEAYRKLASIKGKRSFTIAISELVDWFKGKNKSDIMEFAGILSDDDANALHEEVGKIRKSFRART